MGIETFITDYLPAELSPAKQLADHAWDINVTDYDLIVEKDGQFQTVQCKATQTSNDIIDFRSTGGTKGLEYDNVKNHSELDWLFCVNKDLNMWLIPSKELPNSNRIVLRTELTKNNQGFQTHKYWVQFPNMAP